MNKEQIMDMIGEAPDQYVQDAQEFRKKRRPRRIRWLSGIAAVLALVLLVRNFPVIPLTVSAKAVSTAPASRKPERPKYGSDQELIQSWVQDMNARSDRVRIASRPISDFAGLVSEKLLSGTDEINRVWSPINAYIALAMTAELAGGETQAQLLNMLGIPRTAELRHNISNVWEEIYENNGKEISILANSLWLDQDVEYVQEKMDTIAYHYYASVYQGDLGSSKTNKAMSNWMRNQTGGFLNDRSPKCQLDPRNQVLAIASTIYFQSKWADEFSSGNNTQGIFHAVTGDRETTFMNKKEYRMGYYWGEDFGAVAMRLENDSIMWFILPDEGKNVDDVLSSGEYMQAISGASDNFKWMKVNLSVPRFDISSDIDLKDALQSIGLAELFDREANAFSPSIHVPSLDPVYLDSINQDTRVKIDETGVVAASYIELNLGAIGAMPPEEIIDFILDRPFLFAITKSQIPLFVGTVNMP